MKGNDETTKGRNDVPREDWDKVRGHMAETLRSNSVVLNPVDLRQIAEGLKEHNDWRLGRNDYAWDGPHPQNSMPFPPEKLEELLDEAVEALEAVAAEREGTHLNFSYWDPKLTAVEATTLALALRLAAQLPGDGEVRFGGMVLRRDFDRVRLFKDDDEGEK